MFDVVYAEDNPLWIVAGAMLAIGLFAVILVLGAFYLAGLGLARLFDRWREARKRRRIQAKPVLR